MLEERLKATYIVDLQPTYEQLKLCLLSVLQQPGAYSKLRVDHPFALGIENITRAVFLGLVDEIADEYLYVRSKAGERILYLELVLCYELRSQLWGIVFNSVYHNVFPVSTMCYATGTIDDVSYYDTFDGNLAVCWR